MRLKIRNAMRGFGATETIAFGLGVAVAAVALAAFLYFGARPVVQEATDGPDIPEELADHQERAGLERGRSTGATPSKALPRPDAFLAENGISYAFHNSPNWSSRGTCGTEAVVLHVTGPGSMAGMASWFKNPSSQVSAHFGIGKKGEVHQYVELGDSAWHAGIINRPNLSNPVIANWVNSGVNPNRCHIGIELLLGGPAEPLVEYPEMQRTLDLLLGWILSTTKIPGDRTHIIGHYEIDGVNRSTDPRCCVDIDAVIKGLGAPPVEQRVVFADGWSYLPTTGEWFNPAGEKEWSACDSFGNRWNYIVQRWFPQGATGGFDPLPTRNYWSLSGTC